jgi:hypothetical protein
MHILHMNHKSLDSKSHLKSKGNYILFLAKNLIYLLFGERHSIQQAKFELHKRNYRHNRITN